VSPRKFSQALDLENVVQAEIHRRHVLLNIEPEKILSLEMLSKNWSISLAALVPLAVSIALGCMFKPGPWFKCLNKPCLMPPGWVFAAVWTVLYPFIGWAMVSACYGHQGWTWFLPILNIVLSLAFSPIMFGMRSLEGGAMITIGCLSLGVTLIMQYAVVLHSNLAIGLMVPYVLWLLLASYLAWYIWKNNDCKMLRKCGKLTGCRQYSGGQSRAHCHIGRESPKMS
jgi:tryptophan-rich sensory protein